MALAGQDPQQNRMEKRKLDRLVEELFRSIFDGANGRVRSALAQQGDHRHAGRAVPHVLQQVKRITVREGEVQNGCVGTKLLQLQLSVVFSRRFGDRLAAGRQVVADAGTYDRICIDYENSIFAQALTCHREPVLEGLGYAGKILD